MMENFSASKKDILEINQEILALCNTAKSIPGLAGNNFTNWEQTCRALPGLLTEETIRVAIVGSIKSGKSTLLNSIFKGDFVKRGAGVITSIVTRVRKGSRLNAKLFFKSWDEVNAEIEQALVLFPSLDWGSGKNSFDIRNENERKELQLALDSSGLEQRITRDTRNINHVILSSYLKGFPKIQDVISNESRTQQFDENRFYEHRSYVGDETLSVYLRDIQLEINSGNTDGNIEIADCQGSDSSNPLHLAMIQDYLLTTHLIIYVVSSRIGLRQADIRFLSMIKKMGIFENILFVVNCDFSEHDSIADLRSIVARVKEELAILKSDPQIFSFSGLYNLFSARTVEVSKKDRLRLQQWQEESEMVGFSGNETQRFEAAINGQVIRKRYSLLLENHIDRLGVILAGMNNWIEINKDMLERDTSSALQISDRISQHEKRSNQIKDSLYSLLTGAVGKIRQQLNLEVNRHLDANGGEVIHDINRFIDDHKLSPERYETHLAQSGFAKTMYQVYQDFKHDLDSFITESINPDIIKFIVSREKEIETYFQSIIEPFGAMLVDDHQNYQRLLEQAGIYIRHIGQTGLRMPEIEAIARNADLKRPPLVAAMRYSAKIKTEAIMRLGVYKVLSKFKKAANRTTKEKKEVAILALQAGTSRMKLEARGSITDYLRDYKENLKFSYFFKLVDATVGILGDMLQAHFQAYITDLSEMITQVNDNQIDRGKVTKILNEMSHSARDLHQKIETLKKDAMSGFKTPSETQ